MESQLFVRVALNVPAKDGLFDYHVPENLQSAIQRGSMVAVPFGNDYLQGVVIECNVKPTNNAVIRDVWQLADETPVLTEAQLQLAEILAQRYLATIPECINILLTEKLRRMSEKQIRLLDRQGLIAYKSKNQEQDSLFPQVFAQMGDSPSIAELIGLFDNNDGRLSEKIIQDRIGAEIWRKLSPRLLRKKIIQSEKIFKITEIKPKTVRLAISAGVYNGQRIARTASARARREQILTVLAQYPDGIPTTELMGLCKADFNDLNRLAEVGLLRFISSEVWRDYRHLYEEQTARKLVLNGEQQAALDFIMKSLKQTGEKKPILLHGVTGSGKTEVYLQASEEVLRMGKQVLMMVPEIALTPQILRRFSDRFPEMVGVYHSKMSPGERFDTWRRGRSGQYRIIIGPRSALAVPLPELGLIICDECHEDSYYQTESRPYFSAIQICADYARITQSQLILGSATPTVSQFFKAKQSGWPILEMKQRATGVQAPDVHIIDMRLELKSGNRSVFSRHLMEEIKSTLDAGLQSLMFLNRRGSATHTFCHFCGKDFNCPNCDIPLTWHKRTHQLVCHFCGHTEVLPSRCPVCGKDEIHQFGTGVEQIETLLKKEFPDARILRMDTDSVSHKGQHEEMLSTFARHEADIMIGTQMIAKGLDFPDVRLVGILLADVGINFHDYRVDEHAYQMLTQVSGRAGRSRFKGLSILQTFQPDRYSIQAAAKNNYEAYYQRELAFRRSAAYPPFSRMVRIEIATREEKKAEELATQIADRIRREIDKEKARSIHMIGPAPCFFARVNNRYRWHIILRGGNPVALVSCLKLENVRIEVDPPSIL